MIPSRKITLEDIAARAGVSIAAVSQALSGKGALSQATRERILHVVEELSYQPDRTAQSLALRRATQAGGKIRTHKTGKHLPPPGVMVFYTLQELIEVLELEIDQREEEGYSVNEFRQILSQWNKPTKQKLYRLYSQVISAPMLQNYPYDEPGSLAEIRAARPPGPRQISLNLTSQTLYDKIFGAWLGRIIGCVLGKPLQAGLSKKQVIQYLTLANDYPVTQYIPRLVPLPEGFETKIELHSSYLGEIHGAPFDDDTDYTILALHIMEEFGTGFKTSDVATEWLNHIPYFGTYTTDRAIYRNLIWNIHPEETSRYVNPEREYIGARTRADLYGYICPGKPELAAALAYKDAALSHTKNGLYSAMMMSAMLAWSYVTSDPVEIIHVGLSEIPQNCRLAEAVRAALTMYANGNDWELTYEQLLIPYGGYAPIHAINNMLWVVLALLYSNTDFTTALHIAVTCGMDTGSNAASAGSLLGLITGYTAIPAHWAQPLEDTLYTSIAQFPETRISQLAHRTAHLTEKILSAQNHS